MKAIDELQQRAGTARGKRKPQVLLRFDTADTLDAELQALRNELHVAHNLIRAYQGREERAAANLATMRSALEALVFAYDSVTYSDEKVGDDDVVTAAERALTQAR